MTILSYKCLHRDNDGRYYTQPGDIDTRTYWTDSEGNGLTNVVEGKLVQCKNALHSNRTAEASCARSHKYRGLVEIPDDSPIVGDEFYSRSMTLVQVLSVEQFVGMITDVNQANSHGDTPLNRAARNGRLAIVNALIAAGADVNKSNSDGWTPLNLAAFYGHLDVVKALKTAGAE